MPKKMVGGRKTCQGWISDDDDQEMSDEGAMRVIDGLVAETGYNADKAKKAAKKVRFDDRTAAGNRRGKEHGKKDRAVQIATTSSTAAPRPSNNDNVVIHDVKEEPIEAMTEDQLIESADVEPRRVSRNTTVKKAGVSIKEKGKEFGEASSSSGPRKNPVLRKGKQAKEGKGKQSAEITEEMSNGAKKFTWKNHITNGKKSAKNVMHFPKEIAKKCLREYQDEIKVVDVENRQVLNCNLHKASRKGVPSTYERYIAQGWYELAKSKRLRNGDTLIWSMLRFSPYVNLIVEKRRRN